MPESPEVQALADFVGEHTIGRAIDDVDVLEFRTVKTRGALPGSLAGERVTGVGRFGKHLDLVLGDRHLVISLGRHGWARWTGPGGADEPVGDEPPALAALSFDDGTALSFTDAGTWVSLGLFVVDDPRDVPAIAKLGPDPASADFAPADLDAVIVGRRKQLKAVLQEQESLAGIGNAYSDEILHRAKLSPVMHAATLDAGERERLYAATTTTIRDAITARRGIPIDQLKAAKVAAMRVHGRAGEPCDECGGTVRSFSFGSTTAEYCPTCQTDGVLLGDDA